jgi:hypothetical protein
MSDRQQETDLRARFDAQRRADAQDAPAFADVMARARAEAASAPVATSPRWHRHRTLYISTLAAAAAIAALIVVPRVTSNEDAFEQAVRAYESGAAAGAWRSPTDGLLNVPGSQLMTTMPNVGITQ